MASVCGQSGMSSSSSIEENSDIICELAKKPFSACATAQQNVIVKQRPTPATFRLFRSGKVFKCRGIQRKDGFVDLYSNVKCFVGRVSCFALEHLKPRRRLVTKICGVFSRTARNTKTRSHT